MDKPFAMAPLNSYRYRGPYGWIMIGATDEADALREARRSTDAQVVSTNLEYWDGKQYTPSPNR